MPLCCQVVITNAALILRLEVEKIDAEEFSILKGNYFSLKNFMFVVLKKNPSMSKTKLK